MCRRWQSVLHHRLPADRNEDNGLAEDAVPTILELAETASVAAIGPGIGLSARDPDVIEILLVQLDLPVVLDADGVNAS